MIPSAAATPVHDVREAATLAGAHSFEIDADNNPRACFRNGWGAARFLLELARKDARREWVRAFALWMRQQTDGTPAAFARALQAYGQSLPFAKEDGEIFQGCAITAQKGGDCDCHARLIYALAKGGGLPTEFGFLHKGENPTHVFVRVFVDGRWVPLETTIAARFGEDPFSAARRLGVVREDMQSPEIITMGETDNGDCPEADALEPVVVGDEDTMGAITRPEIKGTRQLDDAFFDALVAGERTDGGTAEMRAAVLYSESGLQPAIKNKIGCVGLNQFCPGTLERFFRGSPSEYLALSAGQQMRFIREFWQGHAAHYGKNVYDGIGRNLYWINFLPDSYNGGVDDSWLIATGPRTGSDADPSTWDPSHDVYIAGPKSVRGPLGTRIHVGSLLKQNPSFVTNEGSQRVIRAAALTRALTSKIQNNPHDWAEVLARINYARAGGGPARSVGAAVALLLASGGLGALARYFFA